MTLKEDRKKASSDPNEDQVAELNGSPCSSHMAPDRLDAKAVPNDEPRKEMTDDDAEECCGEV
jgi:hypothetical protein